jgi:penicillin-insensitive murein endopeptidase
MHRLLICIALATSPGIGIASTCYGTVAHGRLEEGMQLPKDGANFVAYSSLGVQLGRTYVHSAVREIVVDAYRALELSMPKTTFVYGETGFAKGGQIRPHKTHQAGLSVDFMVPVLNAAGASVPLPGNAANKFGYGIEFDNAGKFKDLRIDYEAMAEHLYQLSRAPLLVEKMPGAVQEMLQDALMAPRQKVSNVASASTAGLVTAQEKQKSRNSQCELRLSESWW